MDSCQINLLNYLNKNSGILKNICYNSILYYQRDQLIPILKNSDQVQVGDKIIVYGGLYTSPFFLIEEKVGEAYVIFELLENLGSDNFIGTIQRTFEFTNPSQSGFFSTGVFQGKIYVISPGNIFLQLISDDPIIVGGRGFFTGFNGIFTVQPIGLGQNKLNFSGSILKKL